MGEGEGGWRYVWLKGDDGGARSGKEGLKRRRGDAGGGGGGDDGRV